MTRNNVPRGFARQARRSTSPVQMGAIGNDAAGEAVAGERRAGRARLPVAERAHGVEQVGDAGEPLPHRRVNRVGIGLAVAGGDDDAARGEGGDIGRRHTLRRQRHQDPARAERGEQVDVARGEWPDRPRIVRPAARGVDVGPFEVDAEHARLAQVHRLAHRGDGPRHVGACAGDEGRKKSRCAEGTMGPADRCDRCCRRRLVEHRAAAAIDLQVDEPGGERAAREPRDAGGGRDRVLRHDVADCAIRQQRHAAGNNPLRRVQPGAHQGFHHRPSGPCWDAPRRPWPW